MSYNNPGWVKLSNAAFYKDNFEIINAPLKVLRSKVNFIAYNYQTAGNNFTTFFKSSQFGFDFDLY